MDKEIKIYNTVLAVWLVAYLAFSAWFIYTSYEFTMVSSTLTLDASAMVILGLATLVHLVIVPFLVIRFLFIWK